MKVNSNTEVANLRAANATQADDAGTLDGKDSSAFMPTTTYAKNLQFGSSGEESQIYQAFCNEEEDVLLSGGVKLNDVNNQEVVWSRPDPEGTGWQAQILDNTPDAEGVRFEITLLCADLGTADTP
jgi:hypothetical protein